MKSEKNIEKIVGLLIFILFPTSLLAQIKIMGEVIDEKNRPIEFANVFLSDTASSRIINGVTTSREGKFTIETDKKETFTLKISFIGFKDYQRKIVSSEDLGRIVLLKDAQPQLSLDIRYRHAGEGAFL